MDFLGTMVISSQQGDASMQVVMQSLTKFVDLLKNPQGLQAVTIPSGTVNPPLGVYRLKIIEFFVILFKHFEELTQVHSDLNFKGPMIECGFLPTVVELFFNYPSNNILHNLVSHIVMCIIENKYEEFTTIVCTLYKTNKTNTYILYAKLTLFVCFNSCWTTVKL